MAKHVHNAALPSPQMSQQSYKNQLYTYWVRGASQLFPPDLSGHKALLLEKKMQDGKAFHQPDMQLEWL